MIRQTIAYPDAVLALLSYLRARLATRVEPYALGVKVGNQMPPAATPGRYVLLRRTGGTAVSLVVDAPRIDFMFWHDSPDASARMALAQLVRGISLAAPGKLAAGIAVYRVVEFVGPIDMPDPVNSARMVTMFTHEIRLRGAVA